KKGGHYAVTVLTQPAGQTCAVASGSGTASANVTDVTVTCTTNPTYSVGGTVCGLAAGASVVLQDNGGNNLTVSSNAAFTFTTKLQSGSAYAVTVLTQPSGQTCTVAQGSGTVAGANVTNVAVTCTTNTTYSVGGNVVGLAPGTSVVLQNNGGNNLTLNAAGAFTFSNQLASGASYSVTVLTQPSGQTCAVNNGSGTVAAANVTNISVNCSSTSTLYSIGGTITGLKGAGLKIEDGPSNATSPLSTDTTFKLPNKVANNFEYDVGISAQPAGQTCLILKSHGNITGADVTNVDVRCFDNVTDPIVGTYTIPSLASSSLVYLTFFADGVFIYSSVENNGPNCGTTNGGNGVEYGVYKYTQSSGDFSFVTAIVDTDGGCGVWANGAARYSGTLAVAGSGQSKVLTLTLSGGAGQIVLQPVGSTSGQIIGSWGDVYHKNFFLFLSAGGTNLYSFNAETQQDIAPTSTGQLAGIEYACGNVTNLTGGTYTPDFNPSTCNPPQPSPSSGVVDTNGTGGISSTSGSATISISADTLTTPNRTFTRIKPN
ncbi:MAG TPA: hypothetical protein VMT50_04685, partial [Steroidobacteraceae bacterium]|nr:hypothetical protein [Steroidobacteraceae bacterium]